MKTKSARVIRLRKKTAESMAAEPLKQAMDIFVRLAQWRNRSLESKIRVGSGS